MKLLNHTLKYLSIALLGILGVWATVFYFNMIDEVYDSIDDGLENYKLLIIQKAQQDSSLLKKVDFDESNYAIHKIDIRQALEVRDVYKDTSMYMQSEEDFEPVRMLTTAFEKDGNYYQLKVISSMVEEDDLIEDLLFALIWLYFIMLIVIIVVNNVLLKRIWKPFYHLLGQLRSYELEKKEELIPPHTNVKEFKELNNVVTSLLKRTAAAYNGQKQFIENAAHELQTPLAIGINKLELLIEKGSLNEEDMEIAAQLIQNLERLTRLNKSLLLLSKIENRQFKDDKEVSINEIVRQLKDDFSDQAEFRGVRITVEEKEDIRIVMDRGLAVILITNLIKNAITHTKREGEISIKIEKGIFQIGNTATDGPLDAEKIFQRFYKNSTEQNSTGLGLSIVKAISDLYGILLQYRFQDKHIISLQFKR